MKTFKQFREELSENHIDVAMGKMLDSEGAMIKNQLETIERSCQLLRAQIKSDDMQVPAWVQAKITLSTENILTCANYMAGKDEEFQSEGMTMKDFKQQRSRQNQKEKRASDKIAPTRRAGIHADKASPERAARHRANMDPDFEGNDEKNYPGGKLRPNKVRKAKALGELGEGAAWTKKSGKNQNGGLNEKGRKSYEAEHPGSDLKAPQPEGGSRRDSFCARMKGMKSKLTSAKTARDPDSRINKSLRAWNC